MPDDAASKPLETRLKDYHPPGYVIDTANLQFDLDDTRTRVASLLIVRRNQVNGAGPLVLDGRDLKLLSVSLDGRPLDAGEFTVSSESLTIPGVPEQFTLEIVTEINPRDNTSLQGLYRSGPTFFTQCEAEGFRKITYFIDRPDNLTKFFTTIAADRKKYPVLLSNGNPMGSGNLPDGRHFAKWHDPFPKPSYLFALVAGDLSAVEDSFRTASGRTVALRLFVQRHNLDKCAHALEALKRAMAWDENVYGREYDLDVFMVVATDDFNMGAMENKGLNIFNSKYVLARPQTATDGDFQAIEAVVAHEYFHNWSGNRVTCRDWFQLSLKEGFTVFRDQQYLEDMVSRGVQRIQEVNVLRTHQFREDSSPLAHPVRPEAYVEINNFYTLTVYNKGAEVIRMLRAIVGPDLFRKGTDLYFSRHDGQAVTTDDFVKALEDATGVDLAQFRLWYSQAGTPELHITRSYDGKAKTFILTVRQVLPPTPGQPEKQPMHIPLAMGLLDRDGGDLPIKLAGEKIANLGTRVLDIRKSEERFLFSDVAREPAPSLLRGFSAPVKVVMEQSDDELLFLMARDRDEFVRWDAGQRLAVKFLLSLVRDLQQGKVLELDRSFISAFRKTLESGMQDRAFQAMLLTLPSEAYLADFLEAIDPSAIHAARQHAIRTLATELKDLFIANYHEHADAGPYQVDQESMGRRGIRSLCLAYLMELDNRHVRSLCVEQFLHGGNMTNVLSALASLTNVDCPEREETLDYFFQRWKNDPLVMDKWLGIQAMSRLPGTLSVVRELTRHPVFSLRNPNKVRALIGTFSQSNPLRFHDAGGGGYEFLADYVIAIDPLNSQIAARLATPFAQWSRYEPTRKALMRAQLERIAKLPNLSKDVYEIVSKSLA